jgi:hypothetical protein
MHIQYIHVYVIYTNVYNIYIYIPYTSDIDALGLLGFGGGSWIGRNWSEMNIGFLDFLVLDELVWGSIARFGFMMSQMYG